MHRSTLALVFAIWLLGVWPIVEIFVWGNHGPFVWLCSKLPSQLWEIDPYLGVHMPAVGGLVSLTALLRINSAAGKKFGPVPLGLKVALGLMTAWACFCAVAGMLFAVR